MSYRFVFCLQLMMALSFGAVASPANAQQPASQAQVDWEQRLSDQSEAQRAWTHELERIGSQRITGDDKKSLIQSMITRYPDSFGAANASITEVIEAGDAQQWDIYLSKAQAWFKQHHRWSSPTYRLQFHMARKLHDKEVSATVKKQMFQTLLPWLAHRGWFVSFTRNYLLNSDYTPLEQYQLARAAADVSGPSARVRAYLWTFIEKLQATNPQAAGDACHVFLEQYPHDTIETCQANVFLLQQKAIAGDDQAKADAALLGEEVKRNTAAWKSAFNELLPTLNVTDPRAVETAVAAIINLVNQTPAYCREALWTQMSYKAGDMSSPVRITLMRKFADQISNTHTAEIWRKWTQDELLASSEDVQVLLTIMAQCNDDAGRSLSIWKFVLITLKNHGVDPTMLAKAYGLAADIAQQLGAHDQAATWFFEAARISWANDLPQAVTQLTQAATTSDWTAEGVKAGWMLAFLQGQNSVSQSTSPRSYNPANHVVESLPDCPLPALGTLSPSVVQSAAGWTLASNDSVKNILAHQTPTASDDLPNASNVTDENEDTAWQPATLPAVLIVPLSHQVTPARLTLSLENPTHLAVSFLDANGKLLARFERDWSFWDPMKKEDAWAQGKVVLNLPPVDDVSFVRLELFGSMGPIGVKQMTLTPTPRRAHGWHTSEPVKLNDDTRSVVVNYEAQTPDKTVKYLTNTEASRGYPIFRWTSPWKRTGGWANMRQYGDNISYVFEGQNAAISLLRTGAVDWQIDNGPSGHIEQTLNEPTDYTLATDLPPGRHVLRISTGKMPAEDDQWMPNNIFIKSVNVNGQASARPAVRFSQDGRQWGPWQQSPDTFTPPLTIAIPAISPKPRFAQAGLWLDSQPTKSILAPVVSSLDIQPSDQTGQTAAPFERDTLPKLKNESSTVAQLLAQRRVVVTYPKIGSEQTYQLARAIADKAQVYLVSDDIGLNNYPGLVLAVGSPLRHRYARQLLATHALWLDDTYLQNEEGLITISRDTQGQPETLFVMGETQAAINAAGARLLATLDKLQQQTDSIAKHSSASSGNIATLFPASTLEMVYPWQLHTDRVVLDGLDMRLAQNDRRSVQWGLRADQQVNALTMHCSALAGPGKAVIPANQVILRYATNYEWIPFFGDLRLPNGLSPEPVLPMQANSSLGLWLTVVTSADTKPGLYRGSIEVNANKQKITLPVTVHVEPITLPALPEVATYSFATVPYWFTPGSEVFQKAVVALATNEAEHGVNHLSLAFNVTWKTTPQNADQMFVCDFSQMFKQMAWCDDVYRQRGLPLPVYISQVNNEGVHISQSLDGGKTDRVYESTREMGRQLLAALKKAGMSDRLMLKVGDEPPPSQLPKWVSMAQPFHDAGLRTMTCHNTSYPDMSIATGLINPWVPNYEHNLNLPFLRERQKQGDALWWYVCGMPATRLTGQPVDNLPFYWLTAKWNLQGIMNYAAMHTSNFSTPVPFRYEHGLDHRIMFLADGSVMDTTRRELENDGIRDLVLINLIRKQIATLPSEKAKPITQRLDELIKSIVPYKYRYETRSEKWDAARDALYEMAIASGETSAR